MPCSRLGRNPHPRLRRNRDRRINPVGWGSGGGNDAHCGDTHCGAVPGCGPPCSGSRWHSRDCRRPVRFTVGGWLAAARRYGSCRGRRRRPGEHGLTAGRLALASRYGNQGDPVRVGTVTPCDGSRRRSMHGQRPLGATFGPGWRGCIPAVRVVAGRLCRGWFGNVHGWCIAFDLLKCGSQLGQWRPMIASRRCRGRRARFAKCFAKCRSERFPARGARRGERRYGAGRPTRQGSAPQ